MFINYNTKTGLSISTSRSASAYAGDIGDLAIAVTNGNESVSCLLEGAKDAIEDVHYWAGSSVSIDALEEIHDFICQYEQAAE